MAVTFLISSALHAAILAYFLVGREVPAPLREMAFEVELERSRQVLASRTVVKPRSRTAGLGLRKGRPSLDLRALGVSRFYGHGEVEVSEGHGVGPSDDNPKAAWGVGGGDFKRIEDFSLMEHVREQVEDLLVYPGVFASHEIQGTVNARIVLDEGGRCLWPDIAISSSERHLRVYILDLLRKLCRQDFARFVRGRKLSNVDLSFTFELIERSGNESAERARMIVGNVLLFYRNGHGNVAEWRVGPFRGIFPVPYVFMDFAWLKENWEKVVEGKDPLSEYRVQD